MRKLVPFAFILSAVFFSALPAFAQPKADAVAAPGVVNIAIVNSSLPHSRTLIKGLDESVKVYVVRDHEIIDDVFKRISRQCNKSNETIGSIAVFSPGKSGQFDLGGDKISPRNLKFIGKGFSVITPVLAPDAQLLIYTSEVGNGKNGEKLMTSLKDYFPGKIYMSSNLTGKGGDWDLEISNADTPAPVLVNTEYLNKHYRYALGK